jgi:hypothetical protein
LECFSDLQAGRERKGSGQQKGKAQPVLASALPLLQCLSLKALEREVWMGAEFHEALSEEVEVAVQRLVECQGISGRQQSGQN